MTARQSLISGRVLVDTSAYFAFADTREQNNRVATSIMTRLGEEQWQLFTTNFVLAEAHALFLTRLGRDVALRFLEALDGSATTVIRVSAADEQRARAIVSRYDDKDFSLTDATSFSVMERLRIPAAFTFDRNFAQYGLTVLEPPQT